MVVVNGSVLASMRHGPTCQIVGNATVKGRGASDPAALARRMMNERGLCNKARDVV